jgi:hypothetical protein
MKQCKTCKHRRPAGDHHHNWKRFLLSECSRMPMFWDATEWSDEADERRLRPSFVGQKAFLQDGSDYRAYLLVSDDFGCVMHEASS